MATKARTKKAQGWTTALPKRVAELQSTVEKQVRKGLKQAEDMLPGDPSKSLKKLGADVDRVRADVQKRADKVIDDLRKRAESAIRSTQKRIEDALSPLAKGLDLASKSDLDRIRKRLDQLEKRIDDTHRRSAAAA